MSNPTASPIGTHRVIGGLDFYVCIACTAAEGKTAYTTDAISHVEEMHPAAAHMVREQFKPVHHKIRRSAV